MDNTDTIPTEHASLLEQLSVATQPPPAPILPIVEDAPPSQYMPTDFEPNSANFDDDFAPEPEPTSDTTPEGEALVNATFPPEKLAALFIDIGDNLMTAILPSVYLNTLSAEEVKAIKLAGAKLAKAPNALLTDTEQEGVILHQDFEDYKLTLPLEPDEKKTILAPLKEVLKDVKYQTSPTNALLMAIGMVMLPRAMPIISNKMSK